MHEKSVAAFVNKNRSESNAVVKMYDNFMEIINSIKSSVDSKNVDSTVTGTESHILDGQDSALLGRCCRSG